VTYQHLEMNPKRLLVDFTVGLHTGKLLPFNPGSRTSLTGVFHWMISLT
jgi:hypothetical protein